MVFYSLWSTKPKNFTPKELGTRRQKIRWCGLQSHAPIRTASANVPHVSHVPHVPHVPLVPHAPSALWRHGWHHPLLTRLSRFDLDRPGNLTRSEPPQKKKNALTKRTFDLDQKVKIFKTDLSPSIFRVHFDFGTRFFIRSLEIVQTSNFQKKLTFVQMLTKCQNFWDGPILLNFSSTFRFWSPFRHWRL